ncbi:MAG: DUF4340 domain-containing protein [Pygmaiobacter sp.]
MKLNKQLSTALIVFALIGVLVALLPLFTLPSSKDPQGITLSDRASASLSSLEVKNSFGSYSVTLEGGKFSCPQLIDLPLSDAEFEQLAESVTGIHALTQIKQPDDVAALGFDRPTAVATVRYTDASELTLTIGAKLEDASAYYLRLAEDGQIYTIEQDAIHYLLADVSVFVELHLAENEPQSSSAIDTLTFSSPAASFTLSGLSQPTTDGCGITYTHSIFRDGESAFVEPAALESFFPSLSTLCASSVVQLYPTPEELASYGIFVSDHSTETALSFSIDGHTTELLIGNLSGDYYYVYKHGVNAVFALPLTQVTWGDVSFYGLMSRNIAAPTLSSLSHIAVHTPDADYEIDINGNTATCNGISLSDHTLADLFALLCSVRAEYELTDPPEIIAPELTIVYTFLPDAAAKAGAAPKTLTLRLIPYGLRRDALELDGVARYAVRSTYAAKVNETLLSLRDGMEISPIW